MVVSHAGVGTAQSVSFLQGEPTHLSPWVVTTANSPTPQQSAQKVVKVLALSEKGKQAMPVGVILRNSPELQHSDGVMH